MSIAQPYVTAVFLLEEAIRIYNWNKKNMAKVILVIFLLCGAAFARDPKLYKNPVRFQLLLLKTCI